MNTQAIQHLATLEVLLEQRLSFRLPCHENSGSLDPWFWDSAITGTFTPLKLAQKQGWMQWTDPEVAVETWQCPEQGTASASILSNGQCAMEDDREKILLSSAERDRRCEAYEDLLGWFNQHLTQQRNFIMRCNSDYGWAAVVGQQPDGQWLAIAPSVPQETPCYVTDKSISVEDRRSEDRDLIVKAMPARPACQTPSDPELQTLLAQLPPIQIYGWYDGGYNHTHEYRLCVSQAASQEAAIAHLFQQSGFVEQYPFQALSPGDQLYGNGDEERAIAAQRFAHFDRFLSETFPEMQLYRFCLWDQEFLYFVSDEALYEGGDRVGFSLHSQFTYNP
jgi:hypothetical protein